MLKIQLAADLAATALMAGTALGQVMTKVPSNLMNGSQLLGIDVYGAPFVPSHGVD